MQTQLIEKRPIAISAIIALAVSGVFGFGAPAYSSTAAEPTIIFSGNTLASSLPPTETANRIGDTLALSTGSLTRIASTTRTGYTFGGWSLAVGDAATTTITTATTADTTRTIHAVWNTTITYNVNGATSGVPTGSVTSATYRFGQDLTLPTAGTMVKSGYAFGGWMSATVSTNRFTTYTAAADAVGNPTVYAAWIKTVTFNANTATTGVIPVSQVHVAGGPNLKLPVLSEMTLRKPGYDFMGWSTTSTGTVISNPTSYLPMVSQQTLYAIWKIQTTKAANKVFFKPGKSGLRASQKLVLRDLVDSLRGKTAITIQLSATRPRTAAKSLGKSRNVAVINYLRARGVTATFKRENLVGKGNLSTAKKNNRVILRASWTNPIQ
jgi:uncharacterized repeat protein (TIGR02543 family)